MQHLSEMGARVTGSAENEIQAVQFLMMTIRNIQQMISPGRHTLEIDLQHVNGSFETEIPLLMDTIQYFNLQNVVARLSSLPKATKTRKEALLINCHFDTQPRSPGASDCAIHCAIMLEILDNLVRNQIHLRNDIIFLFNGAEEMILPASHGFITQHPWAKDIRAFINMEASGAGGKEVLFQFGPDNNWLLDAYLTAAPHPSMSVIAHEVYQNGLVPSVTDFRIFRDYGGLSGLDLAHVDNGYVYHTMYDTPDQIGLGAIQHTGDNVLEVTKYIGNIEFDQVPSQDTKEALPVYFDVMGRFAVVYPYSVSLIINTFCVLVTIMLALDNFRDIAKKTDVPIALLVRVAVEGFIFLITSVLMSISLTIILAFFLDHSHAVMSWYSKPFLLFLLYSLPAMAFSYAMNKVYLTRVEFQLEHVALRDWIAEDLLTRVIHLIISVFVTVGTALGIRSTYLAMVWLLFPVLGRGFAQIYIPKGSLRWVICILFIHALPFLISLQNALNNFRAFVPIMGRNFAVAGNPDLVMGALATVFTHAMTLHILPMLCVITPVRHLTRTVLGIWAITVVLVVATPFGFPYVGPECNKTLQAVGPYETTKPCLPPKSSNFVAPFRSKIYRTHRTFYNYEGKVKLMDYVYILQSMDYNEPLVHWLNYSTDSKHTGKVEIVDPQLCEENLMCGVSFNMPHLAIAQQARFYLLESTKPRIDPDRQVNIRKLQTTVVDDHHRKIFFEVRGSSRTTMYLSAKKGIRIEDWSFSKNHVHRGCHWQNGTREAAFVSLLQGGANNVEKGMKKEFWLSLHGIFDENPDGVVDIAVAGHHQHGKNAIDDSFEEFLSGLPTWVYSIAWTTDLKIYTF